MTNGLRKKKGKKVKEIDSITFDRFAQSIVGVGNLLKIPTDCAPYEKGWRYGRGKAFRVAKPGTVEEVCALLRYCNEHHIPVVAQGGNTGLVGASVPDNSAAQLVLSLSRLNKQIQIDAEHKIATVSAGVILEALNDMLEIYRLWLPVDIGSGGSAQIGGMIATNAAGTRAGRYGNMRARLISLKVALANGDIKQIDCTSKPLNNAIEEGVLLQDNTRLYADNPFCGTGGWLGVVVEATLGLEALPKGSVSALLLPEKDVDIDQLVMRIQKDAGEKLSAIEGMADEALHIVAEHMSDIPYLFASENLSEHSKRYALLVEFSSPDEGSEWLQAELETCLMNYMEEGLLQTARTDKPTLFWQARHAISESLRHKGEVIACDIAVPLGKLAAFRKEMDALLLEKWPFLKIIPFGHEMLGACHYNILWPTKMVAKLTSSVKEEIKAMVYKTLIENYNGTFSAEHGIGPHNQHYYDRFIPAAQKEMASKLKTQYDPKRILNPNIHYD